MAPLMSLNGDDIVKALLLEPTCEELRTSPTPGEEATLLGEELELPEVPAAAASLQEHPETPKPEEPTEWINTLSIPVPSPLLQNPAATLLQKQRNLSKGLSLTWTWPATRSSTMMRRVERYLTGGVILVHSPPRC